MTRKRNHILVVECRSEDAQIMREAFAALPECGECVVCRNPSEVRAYLSGAGIYRDRLAFPRPDVVLFSFDPAAGTGYDLLRWIGQHSKAQIVVLLNGAAAPDPGWPTANPVIVEKPGDLQGLKQLLKTLAAILCAEGSSGP